MSYLIAVAAFGVAATLFLWLRDARIYYRTGLPGYRKAAYRGVIFGAIATLGFQVAFYLPDLEILGLAVILLALYLLVNQEKEQVWTGEGTAERFFGSVPVRKANKK
jgi:hypothetical protein